MLTDKTSLLPKIIPAEETKRITEFIKKTFEDTGVKKAVIGLSGGIDSTVAYFLLKKILSSKNIIAVHLPYGESQQTNSLSILKPVDEMAKLLKIDQKTNNQLEKIRFGNVLARMRMIILFDLAKKNNALVCGTENKTEKLLGYFTRFGDEASDLEPIQHLYKTQVYDLAKYLNVPEEIINQKPTAGLWQGQTDEGQFGFTYKEADQVLYGYFEKRISTDELIKYGFKNAEKIIDWSKNNHFKHLTPYKL
jgi:NAD+ synthase